MWYRLGMYYSEGALGIHGLVGGAYIPPTRFALEFTTQEKIVKTTE